MRHARIIDVGYARLLTDVKLFFEENPGILLDTNAYNKLLKV